MGSIEKKDDPENDENKIIEVEEEESIDKELKMNDNNETEKQKRVHSRGRNVQKKMKQL